MREKSDDDICFPGDKIPDRSASRNIIVYKNPCLDKRRERKETDGTIFRRIVTGVPLFVMGYARMFPVNMKNFHEEKGHQCQQQHACYDSPLSLSFFSYDPLVCKINGFNHHSQYLQIMICKHKHHVYLLRIPGQTVLVQGVAMNNILKINDLHF